MKERNSISNSVKYLLSTHLRLWESLNFLISINGMVKKEKGQRNASLQNILGILAHSKGFFVAAVISL